MLLALAAAAVLNVGFKYTAAEGLNLSLQGIPIVQGSWFQYYAPGWTKGYYSSIYNPQTVTREADGSTVVVFRSGDGKVSGRHVYRPDETGVSVDYEFAWHSDEPAMVELAAGMLWAPALTHGSIRIDGGEGRSLGKREFQGSGFERRTFGPTGSEFRFLAPVGEVVATSPQSSWVCFDGRGYNQSWAQNKDLFWFGSTGVPVAKDNPAKLSLRWSLTPGQATAASKDRIEIATEPREIEVAREVGKPIPLVPRPKYYEVREGVLDLGQYPLIRVPQGDLQLGTEFTQTLYSRWEPERPSRRGQQTVIEVVREDLKLPAGAYSIEVGPSGAKVRGQDDAGLIQAMRTLAKIAVPYEGRIGLPYCRIDDWPRLEWRGVHLFVGPQALDFHQMLITRALAPLGFNKVVLQCERSDWLSTPGIQTSMTMPRRMLKAEFDYLRSRGIEPIPLIQSFGHMEWLFANGQNRELAFNPDVLYSVDPRKPATRHLLSALWDEAIELLEPKTIHFGLDEVDMRGWPEDPALVTELWGIQLPFLTEIAKRHGVHMMLWGDKGLAPGEAIDAALGDTPQDAAARRRAIPSNAMIADWHYKDDPNPEGFLASLKLWKKERKNPIASTWFRPNNIRGFVRAAAEEGVGMLQTTWAGYESNERNMLRAFHQFSAMVLAADYAWTGRMDLPSELDYDPVDLMGRMLYGPVGTLRQQPGFLITEGEPRPLGDYQIPISVAKAFRHSLTQEGAAGPLEMEFKVDRDGTALVMALDCLSRLNDGDLVGTVEMTFADGGSRKVELRYGEWLRAYEDEQAAIFAPRVDGLALAHLPVFDSAERENRVRRLEKVRVTVPSGLGGLRIHGMTLLGLSR